MSRIFAGFTFFVLFSISGFSQSLTSTSPVNNATSLLGMGTDDWTFFHNDEEQTIYIDFETIAMNLHDIKVVDDSGQVVIEEPLFDLPVNAIYELDLKGLKQGEYTVKLSTFGDTELSRALKI